jgi:hypothetical protein
LIQNETRLIDTALQCVYACRTTSKSTLGYMSIIYKCLPERDAAKATTDAEYSKLQDRVDAFEIHLEACELLHRSKVNIPIRTFVGISTADNGSNDDQDDWLAQASPEVLGDADDVGDTASGDSTSNGSDRRGQRLIVALLRQGTITGAALGSQEWQELARAVSNIQTLLLPNVTARFCVQRICESLLCNRQWELAREYLSKLGDREQADALIVQVSQELFNSASSMDDPVLEQAQQCLDLASAADCACGAERELHDAIRLLRSYFCITILPVQVRLLDKHTLIERVLDRSSDACLDPEAILDLASKLGLQGSSLHQVRLSIASRALLLKHFDCAIGLCRTLMMAKYAKAWQLCVSLATANEVC